MGHDIIKLNELEFDWKWAVTFNDCIVCLCPDERTADNISGALDEMVWSFEGLPWKEEGKRWYE